jgi:hypothetical protein
MATTPTVIPATDNTPQFPYPSEQERLDRYAKNKDLFQGNHFDAFKQSVNSTDYNKNYSILRYVAANFAGLISKVCADMLFSEPPKIKTEDGDQDFLDAIIFDNELETQLYESELSNSYNGDAVFKLRVGQRTEGVGDSTVIIEQIDPSFYYPHLDPNNVQAQPKRQEIAYAIKIGDKTYLRKEIHEPGKIFNELWILDGNKITGEAPLELLNIPGLQPEEDTGIDRSLIIHIPNWKDGSSYFGYDDYSDLLSLFYALNNRMTKTENILDKHSDPILAVPDGVLDENGQVRREKMGLFLMPDNAAGGAPQKPEYITWNANLDAAFKEVEQILELLYMFSETSPSAFGVEKSGAKSESGRALKYRLMRTIHKVRRKRNYYDRAIKEILFVAQLLAKEYGLTVNGVQLSGEPVVCNIEWQDGIPVDSFEQAQEEEIRLASGNTSLVDSIMRLDGVDEDEAEKTLEKIRAENKANMITLPSAGPAANAAGGDTTAANINGAGAEAAGSTSGRDIVTPKVGQAAQPQPGG